MSYHPKKSRFDYLFINHLRLIAQLMMFILISVWQLPIACLGLIIFLLLSRLLKFRWWLILVSGVIVAVSTLWLLKIHQAIQINVTTLVTELFNINSQWIKLFVNESLASSSSFLYNNLSPFLLGFPLLAAGFLATLDLLPLANKKIKSTLSRGQAIAQSHSPFPNVEDSLATLRETNSVGTLLGVSKMTQKTVIISDEQVNQMILVLGTTGSGKTITLRRFYQRALSNGSALIIVDGKPTDENVRWVMHLAEHFGRRFYGFNCGGFDHYDCLAHGGYTELKDKIISLKDEWESDYYRSIAEDYLQTTFEVLIKSREKLDLQTVVECLDYEELTIRVRAVADAALMNRVSRLERYARKDITGLQAHLNLLIHSELGQYFECNSKTFSLTDVIQNRGVVYFALPALRFPSFSKVLGKLVINDIKAVIDRVSPEKVFTVFDEFSVFAGEQVLNLVNMGRGKGIHAIFGTQGLADLQKINKAFVHQVLNSVNTLICHRLNDQDSAQAITNWIGTRDSFDWTAQINGQQCLSLGSVKRKKEFIVHPDAIKQELQPGEAFYATKVGHFQQDKIKVNYS